MGSNKPPHHLLKRERELRGWSQAKVAEQLDTSFENVSRWERGITLPQPHFREKLCELFGKNAEALGFIGEAVDDPPNVADIKESSPIGPISSIKLDGCQPIQLDGPVYIHQQHAASIDMHLVGENGMIYEKISLGQEESFYQFMRGKNINMNELRRKLLQLGIVGATTLIVAPSTNFWETDIRINDDHMVLLENEMISRWMLYYTGGTARASVGFDIWLQDASRSAQLARGTTLYERAHRVLCMSYQLQGCILRDTIHFPEAHKAFRMAFLIAQELHNPELMGASLAREGVTLTQQDLAHEAVISLNQALDVVRHLGFLTLEGYILQGLSEAQAKEQSQASWKSLECAEKLLDQESQVLEGSLTRFNAASVIAQRGVNAAMLQDYTGCIEIIDKSLRVYDATLVRGRARLIVQKAEANWQLRAIDACTLQAQEAFLLASSAGASKTVERAKHLHAILLQSPYGKERGVAELSEVISTRNM